MRKKPAILSFLLLILLWINGSAQNTANITMAPLTTSVAVGNSFVVMVKLDFTSAPGTSSLDAIGIHLTFDKTKLLVTSVVEQPVVAAFTSKPVPVEASPYTNYNNNGQIDYEVATTASFPNSDFDVLAITFQAIGGGNTSTPLTFRRNPPFNNTDGTRAGLSILTSPFVTNGTVNITAAGCTLASAQISNTATCNAQSFNLVLQSTTGGTGPFDLVINGTTYNNVAVGATITSPTFAAQSVFSNTPPASNDEVDPTPPGAVTLGMKFNAAVAGFVTGARFFSHASPTGTYTAQLWSIGGTLLASATYTSVAGNSWNQVLFPTPVAVLANTNYVISYHSSTSTYTSTGNALVATITNGDLSAPSSGSSGGNGVYAYGVSPTFPTGTFNSTSYWADVLFAPATQVFNLTSVTDDGGCNISGAPLQSLSVTSTSCAVLPITLLNISATPENKNITVNWATAAEFDNKGFEVQRSIDNLTWEGLTFIPGAGNSSTVLNYSYTDKDLFPRTYYYRLKQVDIDGKFKFSVIVSATIAGKPQYELNQNYPNPFNGETAIRYTLPQSSKVILTVFDLNGRSIQVLVNGSKGAGQHIQKFYPGSLPSGVYYYKLQAGTFTAVKKLVIQ